MTPPIRFLVLVVASWIVLRIALQLPGDPARIEPVSGARVQPAISIGTQLAQAANPLESHRRPPVALVEKLETYTVEKGKLLRHMDANPSQTASVATLSRPIPAYGKPPTPRAASLGKERHLDAGFAEPQVRASGLALGRWSGAAWILGRGGDGSSIASGGMLGGSQAGTRFEYRLNDDPSRPLAISARVSSSLTRPGAEAALGIAWQPLAAVPLHLLAERRRRIDAGGRSAFALLAYGGVSDRPGPLGSRLDAYGQAGVVGARRRDLFADGAVTLVRPIDGARPRGLALGVGAWGGVQPGARRFDIGPRLTTTIGAGGAGARLSVDWRFRVAGRAAPDSGPSITIASDF